METITLEKLIEKVITEKTFILNKDEFLCYDEYLIDREIVKEESGQIKILNSSIFYNELLRQLSLIFNFQISSSFSKTLIFFNKVSKYFAEAKENYFGIPEQLIELLSFLIVESNKKYQTNFCEIVEFFHVKKDDVYAFNSAFSRSLKYLNISPEKLSSVLHFLFEQMDLNATYNLNISDLSIGIEGYSRYNLTGAKELLNVFLKEKNRIATLEAAILVGVYNYDKSEFLLIKDMVSNPSNFLSIVCALKAFSVEDNEEAALILNVIDEINSEETNLLINMPQLFSNILNNTLITDALIKEKCFENLHKLISNSDSGVKQFTLESLVNLAGYDDQVYAVVSKLNNDIMHEKHIHVVSRIFSKLSTCKYFFDFIRAYAEVNKLKFSGKAFHLPISSFLRIERVEFSMYLVRLIIDDSGLVRFVGIHILKYILTNVNNNYLFEINILELPAIEQYKLWVSILYDPFEIEKTIPLVLPLRKSYYPIVSEGLICKIEDFIEINGYTINDIILQHLDHNDFADREIIKRITKKAEKFRDNIVKKENLKELNPYYTQAGLIRKYYQYYYSKLNEDMQKTVNEHSILSSLSTTVVLAKGGGWKLDDQTSISKLSTFRTSFKVPRQYCVSPENFDNENTLWYNKNWTNEFKQWEVIISSLESI